MTTATELAQKRNWFLSAPRFAVVGASAASSKHGFKAVKYLLDHHKDVVPVNPTAAEVLGLPCKKTLAELPDPASTAVSIVVHPEVTLKVLQAAKDLGFYGFWIQPGAEDASVIEFIQADAEFAKKCVWTMHLHDAPVRTRSKQGSKPEPLSTSTNLPAKDEVLKEDTLPTCPFVEEPIATEAPLVRAAVVNNAAPSLTLEKLQELEQRFFTASKFAIVGASASSTKNGYKLLESFIKHKKNVVPINLKASKIQGLECMRTLAELPDPTQTSVSVVVPPKETLKILQQAKDLGIFGLWLQPGAEDDAVKAFIAGDAQLRERCVYAADLVKIPSGFMAATEIHTDVYPPCGSRLLDVTDPVAAPAADEPAPTVTPPPDTDIAPEPMVTPPPDTDLAMAPLDVTPPPDPDQTPVAATVAGVKHAMLSPPSTPPVNKSLKLAPEHKMTLNLGDGIPGLA
ncbi:CoA binding domain-containing protein [Mycena crocata]|nr:CoA binding domain-containing protein [Mycena crocata]